MHRRLLVLKMLVLAIEEVLAKSLWLDRDRIMELTLQYGKGIDLEAYEVEPFFTKDIREALANNPIGPHMESDHHRRERNER